MAHKTLSLFGGLALSFCLASPTFAAKVALSDNQMDAITAGQSTAEASITVSAAGVNSAIVAAVLNLSTSDSDGTKTATIMGMLMSRSD